MKINSKIKIGVLLLILLTLGFLLLSNSKKQTANNYITEQQAINTVKSLPEVKQLLTYKNSFVWIGKRDDKNYYYVQTGTLTDSHTATSNWYKLDSKTGKIVCSMFLYDQQGKFIGSGETKELCI